MPRQGLRYLAGVLALVVAGIHLYWGFPRLITQLQIGAVPDPRPLVFVVSGVAIIFGVAQILDGRDPKPIYLAGIGLMAGDIVGYVAWHTVLGHGGFWPWGPDPITHDASAAVVVVDHLLADPLALGSKIAESVLAGLLAVLYRGSETTADDRIPAIVRSS